MQVFNKKYCLIKKKCYIYITKLITHLKINKMNNLAQKIILVIYILLAIIVITLTLCYSNFAFLGFFGVFSVLMILMLPSTSEEIYL